MARKLVSPRSIQKIVVLDRLAGAVTVHKRRSKKKKAERALKKVLSSKSLKNPARLMENLSDATRLASEASRMPPPFDRLPSPFPRLKFG